MSTTLHSTVFAFVVVLASCCVYAACDDESSAVKEPLPDAGQTPGTSSGGTSGTSGTSGGTSSGDGGPGDCFTNPTTHFEIINACTTAARITKAPVLNKLLSDGGLPPLN